MITDEIQAALRETLDAGNESVLIGVPVKQLREGAAAAINFLGGEGYTGIYVSLHRPRNNVAPILEEHGVDMDDLFFIDIHPGIDELQEEEDGYIRLSTPLGIDELVWAISTGLRAGEGPRFVLVDTWKQIAIDQPLSEQMRLANFLERQIQSDGNDNIAVLMIAEDVGKYLDDQQLIAVDDVISVKSSSDTDNGA